MPSTIGIVASGRTGFSPLDLSPAIWLDASDTSTIIASGSPAKVSQWNDLSGNNRHVTQAIGGNQPGTGTVTQNSKNVITFDGNDWLNAATAADWKFMHDGTDYIVAGAVQWGTTATPNDRYAIVSTFNSTLTFTGMWCGFDDRSSVSRSKTLVHAVGNGSGTNSVLNVSNSNVATTNAFSVFTMFGDPNNATAADRSATYNNSGSANKNNTLTTAVSSADPELPLYVGVIGDSRFSGSPVTAFLVGRIGEIVIVSGANATEANRVALRDYLNTKWAVY